MKNLIIIALVSVIAFALPQPVTAQDGQPLTPAQLLQQAEQAKSNAGALQGQAANAQATANTLSTQAKAEQAKADALIAQARQMQADQALAAAAEASQHAAQSAALFGQAAAATTNAQQYARAAEAAYADSLRYFQQYVMVTLQTALIANASAATAKADLEAAQAVVSVQNQQVLVMSGEARANRDQINFLRGALLGSIGLGIMLLIALVIAVRFKTQRVFAQPPNFADAAPEPGSGSARGVVVLRPELFGEFNDQMGRNRIYER